MRLNANRILFSTNVSKRDYKAVLFLDKKCNTKDTTVMMTFAAGFSQLSYRQERLCSLGEGARLAL